MSKSPARRQPRQPCKPPLSWDRFDAMLTALHQHVYTAQNLDIAMAKEIAEALYSLRAIYQAKLRASFPNKRVTHADLLNAAVASHLVKLHEITAIQAMEAATGTPCRVDPKAVARTLRNRCRALENTGDNIIKWPVMHQLILDATARLRDKGVI